MIEQAETHVNELHDLKTFLSEKCHGLVDAMEKGDESVIQCAKRMIMHFATRKPVDFNIDQVTGQIGIDPDDLLSILNTTVNIKCKESIADIVAIGITKNPEQKRIVSAHDMNTPNERPMFALMLKWRDSGQGSETVRQVQDTPS